MFNHEGDFIQFMKKQVARSFIKVRKYSYTAGPTIKLHQPSCKRRTETELLEKMYTGEWCGSIRGVQILHLHSCSHLKPPQTHSV